MAELARLGVNSPLADFYQTYLGEDFSGGRLGCGLEDPQSGGYQLLRRLNAGLLRTREGKAVLTLDVRNPVTFSPEDVEGPLDRTCRAFGVQWVRTGNAAPIYMDKDGKVVRAMTEVYRQVTGDDAQPTVIGGGTYARSMPGIVAFGPMLPGRECTEHQKDEYILVEDLLTAKEIYRRTIEKLANLT